MDGAGNAYVTGYTSSDETSFPVTVGPDLTFSGNYDAFVAKVVSDSPPPTPPTLISGKQIALADNVNPAKKKLTILSKDPEIGIGGGNGSGDDPTSVGLTVRVQSASASFDNSYTLPASRWKVLGKPGQNKGYKYEDPKLASGPIKSALLKPGPAPGKPGQIQFTGKGSGLGHNAAVNANPVNVEVIAGEERYCMKFGGTIKFKVNSYFKATDAPTSSGCPT